MLPPHPQLRLGPGDDAAVLRIKGTGRGIALATDGNGRLCYLEPREGGRIAVAEAALARLLGVRTQSLYAHVAGADGPARPDRRQLARRDAGGNP